MPGALRAQALADRSRGPLWLPVALGAGIGLYFALPIEPPVAVAGLAAFGVAATAWSATGQTRTGFRIALVLLAALLLGFCLAKARTELVRAPVLARKIGPVTFAARVVSTEPRGRGLRLVLAPEDIRRLAVEDVPRKVRVTARYADVAPMPGSFVRVTAVLMPPPSPAMPGDYDFARWAFFRGIGAVGYVYGRPRAIDPPRDLTFRETLDAGLENLRVRMTVRILAAVPGSWPDRLRGAARWPVTLKQPRKVVYSAHVYPAEVSDVPADYGPSWVDRMNSLWGFLVKENIAPVFIGECGDWLATADAQAWAAAFVTYVNGEAAGGPAFTAGQQGISWSWWNWGLSENGGKAPDFGVLTAWSGGSLKPQQAGVLNQLFFHPSDPQRTAPAGGRSR